MNVAQAFQLAVQYHQAGGLAEAEALYRQILAQEPQHPGALHLLGVLAHQAGRSDVAAELIGRASALSPQDAEMHSNLGEAYRSLGRWDEAIAEYRRALELQPDCAAAQSNLGNVLAKQGRLDEAIAAYRRAVALAPRLAEAQYFLGNALRDQERPGEAIEAYRRALEIRPGYAEAQSNLGSVLAKKDQLEEAIEAYRQALALRPDLAEAHNNLGSALARQGRLDEAMASFRRAIELRADSAEAHHNLGNALAQGSRFDEAITSIRRAIELRPDFAGACHNLANTLVQQGRFDDAIASFRRALELQPTSADAQNNLGVVLSHHGRFDEAIACFRAALQLDPHLAVAQSNLLHCLRHSGRLDAEAMFREHCRWDEVHARPLAQGRESCANDPHPDRRLRVGYVSPDFRSHSVAFFLESLLASHDRAQVEVFCYADLRRADVVTERLRQHAAGWREITAMTDAQVAELVRRDQIDLLIDLAGHTERNRLRVFARQPAPVQVTWLGYWDTTGLRAMDYRLTDALADPPGTTEHLHTEKLVRLPETFACFQPWEAAPPVNPLPALVRGQVTFASFHILAKLNDRLLEWWAEILRQVPGSRLLMGAAGLDQASCQERFREFFAQRGIGSARLEFRERVPLRQYLALHHEVDVLLDAHPCTGHTVSCQALWMGVPVVTLAGEVHCARMVASVLTNLGLPELIAHTPAEYVQLAVELAGDLPRLAALRAGLRARMAASPLLDGPRFARNVEAAYRQMWRTWCVQRANSPAP